MRAFWLSFVDPDSEQNRGVCVVEVSDEEVAAAKADIDARFPRHAPGAESDAAALAKAHALGCNPGGEVASWEMPPDWRAHMPGIEPGKLFSREDLARHAVDVTTLGDDEIDRLGLGE